MQRLRDQERQLAQEREQRFRAELQRQERLAQEACSAATPPKRAATRSTGSGTTTSSASPRSTALLRERQGNLGELFGVTRQIAGDAATVLQQSC